MRSRVAGSIPSRRPWSCIFRNWSRLGLKMYIGPTLQFTLFLFIPSFDIRLMKDGKMKGQAFVSFPNEKSAENALKETNRYILFEKPLVVVSVILHIYCTELSISL